MVLKRELGQDADWLSFTQLANQTGRRVQQTALAALAPPSQKSKARYLLTQMVSALAALQSGQPLEAFSFKRSRDLVKACLLTHLSHCFVKPQRR